MQRTHVQNGAIAALYGMENSRSIFGIEFQSINNATINKNDIIIETGAEI